MPGLTTRKRKLLKLSEFGLPSQRKYPMPDKAHAANAKARATQQAKAGNLSGSQRASIDAKANKVLGEKKKSIAKRAPESPAQRLAFAARMAADRLAKKKKG